MIRVLHLMGTMNCGGSQNMIMNLYRKIDRSKVQFDFLINVNERCFFSDEIESLGGRIFYIPRWSIKNTFSYIKTLDSFLKKHPEIDILHCHVSSSSMINLALAKKYNMYTVSHCHNMNCAGFSLKSIIAKIGNFPSRFLAKHFYACSFEAGLGRYGKRIVNGAHFDVLKNAIDLEKYKPNPDSLSEINEKYNLADKLVIGHVGRFYKVKNHDFLVDVFYEIQKKNPSSRLLLIGGGGEMEEPIKEKIKTLNLLDKVIFTGVTKDVSRFLQRMDAFVFPSFSEGLGIVAIEAQCFGVPCFINDTLSDELYINENVFGISLNKSASEWADIILQNATKKLDAKTGRENVLKAGYDILGTAKKLEDFYINSLKENENERD